MHICFVCTGNTCRSPMAAGLLTMLLHNAGREDVQVSSCGTNTVTGAPANEFAIEAAKELGTDISAHRSTKISMYLLEEVDIIIAMTEHHASAVTARLPQKQVQILGGGIPDPYGGDLDCYRACAAQLLEEIKKLEL